MLPFEETDCTISLKRDSLCRLDVWNYSSVLSTRKRIGFCLSFREKIKNVNHHFQPVIVPINFTPVGERIVLWNKLSTKAAVLGLDHIVIQESLPVEDQPHTSLEFSWYIVGVRAGPCFMMSWVWGSSVGKQRLVLPRMEGFVLPSQKHYPLVMNTR